MGGEFGLGRPEQPDLGADLGGPQAVKNTATGNHAGPVGSITTSNTVPAGPRPARPPPPHRRVIAAGRHQMRCDPNGRAHHLADRFGLRFGEPEWWPGVISRYPG
ncbi:MAG TPA: hypothetical protein VIJ00_15325 [Nakamurella sp.]